MSTLPLIMVTAAVGAGLSGFALYLDQRRKRIAERLGCDVSDLVNCSEVLKSKYGRVLGIPLPIPAIGLYLVVLLLAAAGLSQYLVYPAVLAAACSVVLAYLSFVKLKKACLVCTAIHITNIALLYFSLQIR